MNEEQEKVYKIGAFAKLTGLTERTLRFYDRKQLLKPSGRNSQGHRYYTEHDLFRLQKILTLKYLDFTLDNIAIYLEGPDQDFQQTLAMQHELLLNKYKQLEKVLETVERMQNIIEGVGRIDSNLLLLFISNIQNESNQKEWLVQQQMPASLVEAVFMESMPPERKIEFEREITKIVIQLKEHYKKGRMPQEKIVLGTATVMVTLIEELVGDSLSKLTEQELLQIEMLNDSSLSIDPVRFPNVFTKEEEAFVLEVFAHVEMKGLGRLNGVKGETKI